MKQEQSFRADLTNLRNNQRFLSVTILLVVIIFFWVVVSIFKSQQNTTITTQQLKLAEPLTPTLDMITVESLRQKHYLEESELTNFTIYKLVSLGQEGAGRAIPIEQDVSTLKPIDSDKEKSNKNTEEENALDETLKQIEAPVQPSTSTQSARQTPSTNLDSAPTTSASQSTGILR